MRNTGQLIDTGTGAHIWTDRFDGALDDVFDLQDQVASAAAAAIEQRLRLAEIERASRKPTESLGPYELFLLAIAASNKRTKEGFTEAIRLARRALELDPSYAPAMGRIGTWRVMQLYRHWIPDSGAEIDEGVRMARQAIAAARDDPEVLDVSGFALAGLAGENEAALNAVDRALALNPNFARAFAHRARILAWMNRPEEAIASAQQGLRLSLHDPARFVCAQAQALAHLAAGRYETALEWADRALYENAGAVAARIKLSLCGHLGRRDQTDACLLLMRENYPEPTVAGIMRDFAKGLSPEVAARISEGLRKAGLSEG